MYSVKCLAGMTTHCNLHHIPLLCVNSYQSAGNLRCASVIYFGLFNIRPQSSSNMVGHHWERP